ncbi:MAG TPA: low affinity iron permease family protein [Rhodanobacteraceae bacterium]|nr:low affinity iron permease family protein [Rhodanobacteraceae bacterium]
MAMKKKASLFTRFAQWAARATGKPVTFLLAVLIVVAWAASGPVFHFGDTWQLVINTGTTIITFLMVFLIQNTQNRDSMAVQNKLDELIRAIEPANNAMLELEDMDEEVLERLRRHYCRLAEQARETLDDVLAEREGLGNRKDDADKT